MKKITIEDKRYPKLLKKIKNPPTKLYLEGNLELLNKNIISIVGARNCTERGMELTKKFAGELSDQGLVIASGMAHGIDSAAHIGTIEQKGKTIAVLGSGFNHIFPKENVWLYQEILKKDGLIISEYSPEVKPKSNLFLERNRIVSGISIGILVIEAAYRSGTSVTARLAKTQGRKVFVLPHEIDDKHGVGTNQLIRKGAILVTSTKEIIEEFEFLTYKKEIKKEKKILEKKFKNKDYEKIYKLIEEGTKEVNEISRKTNYSISEITNILFMLEIEGYIKKGEKGYICI